MEIFDKKMWLPNYTEFIIFLIVVLIAFIVLLSFKYYDKIKQLEIHDYELFLFRMKRLGFSKLQIKIVNEMIGTLRLTNQLRFIKEPALFESILEKYYNTYIKTKLEKNAQVAISSDIITIYDKLFFTAEYKKPLNNLSEIEINRMLYFATENKDIFFGKIIGRTSKDLTIKLFRNEDELKDLVKYKTIDAFFIRSGDAEYSFSTEVIDLLKNIISLKIPDNFKIEKEFRHPYVDTIIPCSIESIESNPEIEPIPINGTIFKINENEVIIRITDKLNYKKKYNIYFELMDYKFSVNLLVIANRTIEDKNIYYYTFKFEDMSEASKNVIKKFIAEHL